MKGARRRAQKCGLRRSIRLQVSERSKVDLRGNGRFWRKAAVRLNVRYWEKSGKHMLALSFSAFDPERTSGARCYCGAGRWQLFSIAVLFALDRSPSIRKK
jgi:hypothetical protein